MQSNKTIGIWECFRLLRELSVGPQKGKFRIKKDPAPYKHTSYIVITYGKHASTGLPDWLSLTIKKHNIQLKIFFSLEKSHKNTDHFC